MRLPECCTARSFSSSWTTLPPRCSALKRPRTNRRAHREARLGVRQADLQGRGRQEGQERPDRARDRSQDRAARKGALYFVEHRVGNVMSAGRRPSRRGAGRARGLLRAQRFDPLPRPNHHAHAQGRDRDRGARQKYVAEVPFEALTGLKAFVIANALGDIGAPREIDLRRWCRTCRSSGSSSTTTGLPRSGATRSA